MARVRQLREVPATFRFLSAEPLLGRVDWAHVTEGMSQIIFGGESGPGARPCDVRWIREGVAVCRREGVAPFVKQMGSVWARRETALRRVETISDACAADSHGGDWAEWTEDLRVREVLR